ncbi:Fibroblast growth factor receptor 2 like protein [Verticillium longisporum]|nr:Fibroblast growth factor receptor 2 like protein [Verticillium longisporum]
MLPCGKEVTFVKEGYDHAHDAVTKDSLLGLHPFISNTFPDFEDVTLGLATDLLKSRDFVVVKHPRATPNSHGQSTYHFADIATELQVLRHPPIKVHDNVIDFMGVMYHYTGDETQDGNRIVPALVLEYAAYGNLKEFQISGHANTFQDQIKVALNAASGIQALHRVGMIHGDVKPSNLLVCKNESRGFVVKLADFGFSLSVDDGRFAGHTQMYCAPESYDGNFERQYLKQLDVYSFGLTFLAILESGGTFYDNLPTQDLDINVRKMKTADLMCTTMPMRSPAARFQDMDRIILLLRLAQHVSVGENSHISFNDTTAAQAAEIIKVIGGDYRLGTTQVPPALQQGYPQCLEYIQLAIHGLPRQQPAQLMQAEAKTLRDQAARLAQMTLWMHGFMMNTQERPLGDMLRQIMEKRVIADLFEAVGTPENRSDVVDFDTCKALRFLSDLVGLLPEPYVAGWSDEFSEVEQLRSQYEAKEKLILSRYLDFIPDLAASYATIEKMPWIVLFWAITEDRPDAVALVIREIPACTETQTEPKGDFPLLTASEMFDIAFALCEKGADLHAVAASLLPTQYDTQVNESTEPPSWTPLHWAIWSNSLAAVETLLTLGANPIFSKESKAGEARCASRWTRLLSSGVGFVQEIHRTITTLVSHGAPTDAVLELGEFKVPAVFAAAEHQCFAEVMIAGLENGFAREIDVFPQKDKRHNALLMAINHRDQAMVRALLTAGASTTVEDAHGLGPLERAAKESDDVFFVRSILETGVSADPPDVSRISAFETAVYTGNFNVARFLFDAGAARDRVNTSGRTLLGEMILMHTRNALERIKFLLSLPDREGQDGFIVQHSTTRPISALRFAVLQCKEADPTSQYADITDVMVAHLLEKYDSKNYFDSTDGEGHMSALTAAVGLGNHRVVKRLLEKGADPKIVDDKGRTAMSLVQYRYTDTAERLCRRINQNTSELVGVLVSYGAFGDDMSTPEWYQGEKGYKCTHCVMEALRSKIGDSND